jgi:hypothetical protein
MLRFWRFVGDWHRCGMKISCFSKNALFPNHFLMRRPCPPSIVITPTKVMIWSSPPVLMKQ